jgi:hypothetical protein
MEWLWDQVKDLISDLWQWVWDFIVDIFVALVTMILGAIASVIELVPVPSFLIEYSISDYVPEDIGWFLAQSNFHVALSIVGAGVLFYFLRRVLTLGIW